MDELYKPTARVDHLVVQQVSDETLVYDMADERAFVLTERLLTYGKNVPVQQPSTRSRLKLLPILSLLTSFGLR